MKHSHHIIPRYRGGLDDKSNLIEISITKHAMFHFCNFQLWGDYRDELAWKGLCGLLTKEEIITLIKTYVWTDENKKKASERMKLRWENERDEMIKNMSPNPMLGRNHTEESKNLMAQKQIERMKDLENREKLRQANLGYKVKEETKLKHSQYKWWNNGSENIRQINSPGPEWNRGRILPKTGKRWWNNGICNKHQVQSPGPEWNLGRIINRNSNGKFE